MSIGSSPSTARVDPSTGTEERIALVDGPNGLLYTHLTWPPGATRCVVLCSSLFADFTANYHRERLLTHALGARGLGVARFHYAGEGNSDGDRSGMTLGTISTDTACVVDHVVTSHQPERLAFHGTRLGALVAGAAARQAGAPLSLWEPVADPLRFFKEAFRAKRMSEVAAEGTQRFATWREELAQNGVLDLLGYDAHPAMVESLDGVTLASVLGDEPLRTFVAGFKDRPAKGEDEASFALPETWWFHNEQVHDAGALVEATSAWLDEVTLGGEP